MALTYIKISKGHFACDGVFSSSENQRVEHACTDGHSEDDHEESGDHLAFEEGFEQDDLGQASARAADDEAMIAPSPMPLPASAAVSGITASALM